MATKNGPAGLIFTPGHRQVMLNERRRLKMARSAHAYVRGSTVQFCDWLNSKNGKRVPQGPPIWICGDCHLGNLGPAFLLGKVARPATRLTEDS